MTQNKQAQNDLDREISTNYEAFQKMSFQEHETGYYALLRHGELIETLADKMDAHKLARRVFKDKIYSIQEIHPKKADLGYMSYALR